MTRPERVDLTTADGLTLEGRWDGWDTESQRAVVFCHPHPLQQGTMNAPLMHKVTRRLVERGLAVLRFNFRGVGSSEGAWGEGIAEVEDVAAAVAEAKRRGPAMCLAGWSFGAGMALRWQAAAGDTTAYAGIAPGLIYAPEAERLSPAKRLLILGDRDQLVDVDQVAGFGEAIGATVDVMAGSDHFFYFREERVADLIGDWFLGEDHKGVDEEADQASDQRAVDANELEISPE